MGGVALDGEPLDRITVDRDPLDLESMDVGGMAVAELGVTPAPARRPRRLARRVGALIGAQLVFAAFFGALANTRGYDVGRPWVVATLALTFALTGFFAMSLEFHRHRFTFTLAEAVLAVGFFAAGPIGLAVAAALGECVNMVAQRHSPLKVAFNVSNRLAATTAAGIAFAAFGNTNVHDPAAWGAALAAALCFSILDVVSTAAVISIVEETRFHNVFVRSAIAGLLATLTSAPIGLVALALAQYGPFVPLLLAPIAAAVALERRLCRFAARRAPAVRAPVRIIGAHRQPRRPRRRVAVARGGDSVTRDRRGRAVLRNRWRGRMARRLRRRRRRTPRDTGGRRGRGRAGAARR